MCRGFAASKGTAKEVAAQYEAAIKQAWDSEELREFMKIDDADIGAARKSLGEAGCRACCRRRGFRARRADW